MKTIALSGAFALAGILALAASSAQASIEISVTPWLAPNAFGSPNFSAAESNAVQALMAGAGSFGAPGTPGYFQASPNVLASQTIVTDFPSWMGKVNPGATVGPAFANEYGNRMTFAVSVVATDDEKFSISELSFNAVSNDPGNLLGFSYDPGDYDYGSGYVGVLFGADGKLGGGDDTFITSGANTQLVNAIFARGSGNSLPNNPGDPVGTLAQQQASLDAATQQMGQVTQFTGTYSLRDSTGSGTFNITAAPEPSQWALMILGFGLAGGALRRRRSVAMA